MFHTLLSYTALSRAGRPTLGSAARPIDSVGLPPGRAGPLRRCRPPPPTLPPLSLRRCPTNCTQHLCTPLQQHRTPPVSLVLCLDNAQHNNHKVLIKMASCRTTVASRAKPADFASAAGRGSARAVLGNTALCSTGRRDRGIGGELQKRLWVSGG